MSKMISLRLPDELAARLDEVAADRRIPRATLIINVLGELFLNLPPADDQQPTTDNLETHPVVEALIDRLTHLEAFVQDLLEWRESEENRKTNAVAAVLRFNQKYSGDTEATDSNVIQQEIQQEIQEIQENSQQEIQQEVQEIQENSQQEIQQEIQEIQEDLPIVAACKTLEQDLQIDAPAPDIQQEIPTKVNGLFTSPVTATFLAKRLNKSTATLSKWARLSKEEQLRKTEDIQGVKWFYNSKSKNWHPVNKEIVNQNAN